MAADEIAHIVPGAQVLENQLAGVPIGKDCCDHDGEEEGPGEGEREEREDHDGAAEHGVEKREDGGGKVSRFGHSHRDYYKVDLLIINSTNI